MAMAQELAPGRAQTDRCWRIRNLGPRTDSAGEEHGERAEKKRPVRLMERGAKQHVSLHVPRACSPAPGPAPPVQHALNVNIISLLYFAHSAAQL